MCVCVRVRVWQLVWSQEGALGRQSFAAFMISITIGLALIHIMMIAGNFIATRSPTPPRARPVPLSACACALSLSLSLSLCLREY